MRCVFGENYRICTIYLYIHILTPIPQHQLTETQLAVVFNTVRKICLITGVLSFKIKNQNSNL